MDRKYTSSLVSLELIQGLEPKITAPVTCFRIYHKEESISKDEMMSRKLSSSMQRSHNQSALSLGFRIYTTGQNIIDHIFTQGK
jgi:hypothetical protein